MQISAINNYSVQSNHRQQQNPNFGKLIIDKSVPTELIKPIAKNSEIQKMVGMFHDVGIDIVAKIQKTTPVFNAADYSRPLVGNMLDFNTRSTKVKYIDITLLHVLGFNPIENAEGLYVCFEHGKFLENIDKIKEGTAEEVFNKYQAEAEKVFNAEKERQREAAELKAEIEAAMLQRKMDRKNALAEVEALNKSFEPTVAPKAQEPITQIQEVESAEPVEQKKSFWKRLFNL